MNSISKPSRDEYRKLNLLVQKLDYLENEKEIYETLLDIRKEVNNLLW